MARRVTTNGNGNGNGHRPSPGERLAEVGEKVRGSQAWASIFRPGSIFRKGYTDSPRNRSYVVMNSLIYHLHPVKVKRHAVKVSYTLCLGGQMYVWSVWQKRGRKKPGDVEAATSRFNRPVLRKA